MQESPFTAFLSLVHFDQETNSLRTQLQALQQEIRTLRETTKSFQQEQDSAQHKWHAARKIVDAYELDMKSLEEQRLHKAQLMETVIAAKEHLALRREIDAIRSRQNDLERELVGAWNSLETTKRAMDALTKTVQEQCATLNATLSEKEDRAQQLAAQIVEREQAWSEHIHGLPEDLLQKYTMMRTTVSDPVVPVQQDSCSACFHSLTRQDLSELRLHQLLQCKGCYRFLYLEQPK